MKTQPSKASALDAEGAPVVAQQQVVQLLLSSIESTIEAKMSEVKSTMIAHMAEIKSAIALLTKEQPEQEYYTTAEFAKLVDRSVWYVRKKCEEGRLNAEKRAVGRGKSKYWSISKEEVHRYRNHGLLPELNPYRRPGRKKREAGRKSPQPQQP